MLVCGSTALQVRIDLFTRLGAVVERENQFKELLPISQCGSDSTSAASDEASRMSVRSMASVFIVSGTTMVIGLVVSLLRRCWRGSKWADTGPAAPAPGLYRYVHCEGLYCYGICTYGLYEYVQ